MLTISNNNAVVDLHVGVHEELEQEAATPLPAATKAHQQCNWCKLSTNVEANSSKSDQDQDRSVCNPYGTRTTKNSEAQAIKY